MNREQKERAILRAVRRAAKRHKPCPTNAELAELTGSAGPGTPSHIMQDLEKRGEFTIARHGWARTVFFDDGLHTQFPDFVPGGTRDRPDPRAPRAPIARTGQGAPCASCGCKPASCTCPAFKPTALPCHASSSIETVGARL
ncbi:MAG: hypothetical protein ABJF09_00605 [Qipengyuania citrea]|uniref:hypothetical protein n=1 Tax=Qipengyuania citrea TaxID=225971 RepID=UPI0032667C8E